MKKIFINIAFKKAAYFADKAYDASRNGDYEKRAYYQRRQAECLRGAAWLINC